MWPRSADASFIPTTDGMSASRKTVVPVYASAFQKPLPAMAPEVAKALRQQTEHFATVQRTAAHVRIEAPIDRTVKHTVARVFESYPGLEDLQLIFWQLLAAPE